MAWITRDLFSEAKKSITDWNLSQICLRQCQILKTDRKCVQCVYLAREGVDRVSLERNFLCRYSEWIDKNRFLFRLFLLVEILDRCDIRRWVSRTATKLESEVRNDSDPGLCSTNLVALWSKQKDLSSVKLFEMVFCRFSRENPSSSFAERTDWKLNFVSAAMAKVKNWRFVDGMRESDSKISEEKISCRFRSESIDVNRCSSLVSNAEKTSVEQSARWKVIQPNSKCVETFCVYRKGEEERKREGLTSSSSHRLNFQGETLSNGVDRSVYALGRISRKFRENFSRRFFSGFLFESKRISSKGVAELKKFVLPLIFRETSTTIDESPNCLFSIQNETNFGLTSSIDPLKFDFPFAKINEKFFINSSWRSSTVLGRSIRTRTDRKWNEIDLSRLPDENLENVISTRRLTSDAV